MAEEAHYSSDSAANKRKYEENTPSPASALRRPTLFSGPISSQSPPDGATPASYNSVPPPMDEIQLAKQKAQEIAARLFNNAEATKRPRLENGDSNDYLGQKPTGAGVTPPMTGSYGYAGPSKKIEIPNARVGVIIGKAGETIKYLQLQSGAKIQVTRDMDADPNSPTRGVELMGTPEQIAKAEQLINDVLAEADSGGAGIISRRITGQQSGAEQFVMKVPNNKVGLVIGKGGETIKNMQARSGARIQVIPLHLPPGDTSTERTLQIDGSSEQIEAAKQLVNEVISENRLRNPVMGGYSQQGFQARPPTSWGPPGAPMQQPGYGYVQPGPYAGQPPQYNVNQPPYSGYPQPTSGGYGAAGWDQTTGAPNQQTAHGGGYDYYNQQQPTQHQQVPGGVGAPTDTAAYGYSQPPASGYSQGQGYGQDGYGGYHASAPQSGYGQPQSNTNPGYDQQGYSSATGYGNSSNPTQDSHTPAYGAQGDTNQAPPVQPQQGYTAGQQPSPNPGYPPQASTQSVYAMAPPSQGGYVTQPPAGYGSNYGLPQGQKPPTSQPPYGQPGQSPSAPGGYPQSAPAYAQSQLPPAQSGYVQPDSASQRPSGYGGQAAQPGFGAPATQPGYGAPPYGSTPASQPGYGQQQAPPYNTAYTAAGYAQPPAYSDGSSAGSARGSYEAAAAPASQSSQPAKASPKS